MGHDDPWLLRAWLHGSPTQEPDGSGSQRRVDSLPMTSEKAAFGRSFCLLTRSPHSGLPSRPSIRRESINLDTIAETDRVVSIALISGARWKTLTVAAAPINP